MKKLLTGCLNNKVIMSISKLFTASKIRVFLCHGITILGVSVRNSNNSLFYLCPTLVHVFFSRYILHCHVTFYSVMSKDLDPREALDAFRGATVVKVPYQTIRIDQKSKISLERSLSCLRKALM